MFQLKLAAVVGGVMLAYFGIQEFRVSQGTSEEPVAVDLAELESGTTSDNNHIRIGEHVAVYSGCVYQYRQDRYDRGEPKSSTSVDYTYYPIISNAHPFFDALGALAEKYGTLNEVPDAEWPSIDKFSVLVKTKKFKTIGGIPESMSAADSVQGMVINLIGGLDSEEQDLIRESFPAVDLEQILIVEDGRTPASTIKSLGITAGGMLLSLLGLGGFLMGRGSTD